MPEPCSRRPTSAIAAGRRHGRRDGPRPATRRDDPGAGARPARRRTGTGARPDKPRSLWSDAWRDLRRNPIFIISALVILFLVVISIWPQLIATGNPLALRPRQGPGGLRSPATPSASTARAATSTPAPSTAPAPRSPSASAPPLGVGAARRVLGGLAGFFGGWWDALLSRITDIFFGIPVLLGGLVFLSVVTSTTVWPVVGFIVLLGWPQIARIARGSVITAKQNDYVQAARALGAGNSRMLLRHIAPNAVAPVIVVATIALGTYIALEATLSLPRRRPEAADRLLGHRHLRRLHLHPQRPAHAAVARRRAERHRAGVHHARRRGARRPRPEAAREPSAAPCCSKCATCTWSSAPGTASPRPSTASATRVDAGETLAVLGESGSGKSVTAQAVMGILDIAARARSPAARSSSRAGTC